MPMFFDKKQVHAALIDALNEKHKELQAALAETDDSLSADSKSTAGDKHETGRAMAQLEREKIGGFIQQHEQLMTNAQRLDSSIKTPAIRLGSLVNTSNGWYYISVAAGRIVLENTPVFCLSPAAPLVGVLLGKKSGEEVVWQGNSIAILSVC
jgi:transcription elongation GreA/GreB family factor